MSLWTEYARYVARRWWWLVVGVAGGVLTGVSLITTVSVPVWFGIAVLFGGLTVAQSLAFKDMRDERELVQRALSEAHKDRWALLRNCYREGRKLQERIALRQGIADETRLQDVENKNRTDAYAWMKACWEVLQEHFPTQEQVFMGRSEQS